MRSELSRDPHPPRAASRRQGRIHRTRLIMAIISQSRLVLAAILVLLNAAPARAFQSEHPLTGRRIAPVMGAAGADWLERRERDSEEKPEAALDALGIKPGMTVADIGAGSGYMSLRMAVRVGSTGKVYAEDVQPEMLRLLRANQ